jgi:hypothetical protein
LTTTEVAAIEAIPRPAARFPERPPSPNSAAAHPNQIRDMSAAWLSTVIRRSAGVAGRRRSRASGEERQPAIRLNSRRSASVMRFSGTAASYPDRRRQESAPDDWSG